MQAILEALADLEREKCIKYAEKATKNDKICKDMKKDENKNWKTRVIIYYRYLTVFIFPLWMNILQTKKDLG